MWIRSQNRMQLQDVNRFVIERFETGIYIVGNGCTLGIYSTKEKALKVLDEIQTCIMTEHHYHTDDANCTRRFFTNSSQGSYIYASKEAAINAWNGRTDDDLTNYISKIMNIFYGSFINHNKELILIPKTNLYVCLHDVNTPTDLKFKLLEYCSRECTFVERYSQEWRNRRYQDDILLRINKCLGTNFTQEEMELVYDVLGNGCNHKLAKRFVSSGYDMKLLEEKENE